MTNRKSKAVTTPQNVLLPLRWPSGGCRVTALFRGCRGLHARPIDGIRRHSGSASRLLFFGFGATRGVHVFWVAAPREDGVFLKESPAESSTRPVVFVVTVEYRVVVAVFGTASGATVTRCCGRLTQGVGSGGWGRGASFLFLLCCSPDAKSFLQSAGSSLSSMYKLGSPDGSLEPSSEVGNRGGPLPRRMAAGGLGEGAPAAAHEPSSVFSLFARLARAFL